MDNEDRNVPAKWKPHVARSIGQGSHPWPNSADLVALFAVHGTITAVAEVCGKGRTSLRDFLLLRPALRDRCMEAARGLITISTGHQREVTVPLADKRAQRAVRYVLRNLPEQREYEEIVRRDPCSYCLREMPTVGEFDGRQMMTTDHIEPKVRGGEEHWSNYTGACRGCNGKKNGTTLLFYLLDHPIG